jgi:hypothetical protein
MQLPLPPLRSARWLLLLLLLKGLLFGYFAWELHRLQGDELVGGWFRVYDDTRSYYDPIQLLLEGKGYSRYGYAQLGEAEVVPFAGRLPGLLPIFGPLYALFGEVTAKSLMVLIQLLVSGLSVWVFGLVLVKLGSKANWARAFSLFYLFYYPLHIYDHAGATESLSIAFSIFSVWFYLRALSRNGNSKAFLLLSGLFFAWAVFLRPIFGSFGLVWGIFLMKDWGWEKSLKQTAWLFFAPLLLFLSLWTLRNALTLERFLPLEDEWVHSYPHEPEYGPDGMAIRKLIKAWGGNILYWQEGSMGQALMNLKEEHPLSQLPERIYTPDYNQDSLALLRSYYQQAHDPGLAESLRDLRERQAQAMAERFLASYHQHHPLEYGIGGRLRMMGKFFFGLIRHDLPYPSRDQIAGYQAAIKGGFILLTYLLNALSLMLWLGSWLKKGKARWWSLFPLCMTLILCFGLGMIEERYLLPMIPFQLGALALLFTELTTHEKSQTVGGKISPV